ncbi:hypothetical protein Bbelb_369640 [Branchiostoma belcheri]|nr:hypothetical protein Bbelb_369640 [Branchiostoma belcheri]
MQRPLQLFQDSHTGLPPSENLRTCTVTCLERTVKLLEEMMCSELQQQQAIPRLHAGPANHAQYSTPGPIFIQPIDLPLDLWGSYKCCWQRATRTTSTGQT